MIEKQKSVFISYAHSDALDFTRRLAYSLGMYMDVFWDRRLQAGDFPSQLEAEIERRDYLLLVMTPASIASVWCRRELDCAKVHVKGIVLARVFDGDGTSDPELTSTYTYGDFTKDFDAGFRRVTQMMLNQPYSSWEYLSEEEDRVVIESLQNGILPGIIAKNIIEWLVVDKMWTYAEMLTANLEQKKLEKEQIVYIKRGQPRTVQGVFVSLDKIAKRFRELHYTAHAQFLTEMNVTAANALKGMRQLRDDDHREACTTAFNLFTQLRGNIRSQSSKIVDSELSKNVVEFFEFDLAEKLRETINMYSRRSRYLY